MNSSFDRQPGDLRTKVAAAIALGLVVVATIAVCLRFAGGMLPRVGDIIAFDAASGRRVPTRAALSVRIGGKPAGTVCLLDVPIMEDTGGSLIVEAVLPAPVPLYQVHWSGLRTSNTVSDCGRSADLLITPYDIGVLLFAAGGHG